MSIRAKLLLVLFGIAIGLCGIGLSYPLLKYVAQSRLHSVGSEFSTIADLRNAIVKGDSEHPTGGTVTLRQLIAPHPSDLIMYELLPSLHSTFQGVPVSTNRCGMRGPEREPAKNSDVFRIALLGDSFAFGWGVEQAHIFAQVLENNLNFYTAGSPRVEVLNFGVPGYSTFQEVAQFEEKGIDFNPDAVLVYFVDNDFGLPFFIRDIHQAGDLLNAPTFARKSWKRSDALVESQRRTLESQIDPNIALKKLLALCHERAIPLFVAINPNEHAKQSKKRLWFLRKNREVNTIWLVAAVEQEVARLGIDTHALTLPTDPHPSALKHKILGDVLTQYFLPYLGRKVS